VSGHTTALQWGASFLSGGGLTVLLGWLTTRHRARDQRRLLWEMLTGRSASPGVPAQPSLIERFEWVLKRLDELGEAQTAQAAALEEVREELADVSAGKMHWAEAFDRKLAAVKGRLRRLERPIGIEAAG
jgi:hypothetical protein